MNTWTYIIKGLGSVGSGTVGQCKQLVMERNLAKKAEFMAIDTKPYAPRGGLGLLDPHEDFLHIFQRDIDALADNILLHQEILWYVPSLGQDSVSRARLKAGVVSGVGGNRELGYLMGGLAGPQMERFNIRKVSNLISRNPGARAACISVFSPCGGTGSTLWIHDTYIARHVFKELGCPAIHIGVILFPILYQKENMQEQLGLTGLANTYSSLRDIDILSLESRFDFNYSPSLNVSVEAPPFDFIIPLDGSSSTGSNITILGGLERATAGIITEFMEWQDDVFFEKFEDAKFATYNLIYGKPRRYLAHGVAKLILDTEALVDDLAVALGSDILKKAMTEQVELEDVLSEMSQFGLEALADKIRVKLDYDSIFSIPTENNSHAVLGAIESMREHSQDAISDVKQHASDILPWFRKALSALSIKAARLPGEGIEQLATVLVSFIKGEMKKSEDGVHANENTMAQYSDAAIDNLLGKAGSISSRLMSGRGEKRAREAVALAIDRYKASIEADICQCLYKLYEKMLEALEEFLETDLIEAQGWMTDTLDSLQRQCRSWDRKSLRDDPATLCRSILTQEDEAYLGGKHYPDSSGLQALTDELLSKLFQWREDQQEDQGEDEPDSASQIWDSFLELFRKPFMPLKKITLVDVLSGNVLEREIDINEELNLLRLEAEPKVDYSLTKVKHVSKLGFGSVGRIHDDRVNERLMAVLERNFAPGCVIITDDPNTLSLSITYVGIPACELSQLPVYHEVYDAAMQDDDTFTVLPGEYSPQPDIHRLHGWARLCTELGLEKGLILNGSGKYRMAGNGQSVLGNNAGDAIVHLMRKPEVMDQVRTELVELTKPDFAGLSNKDWDRKWSMMVGNLNIPSGIMDDFRSLISNSE